MTLLRYCLCLILLLATAPHGGSADDTYATSACRWRPYLCGGVNISYPFYLASDTKAIPDHDGESYCGYPGLAVTCDEAASKAVLKLGDDSYTVSAIDYASLTISLSDADVGNDCPVVSHNVTIPPSVRLVLPISAVDHLFFFVNCSFGTSDDASSRPPKPSSIKPITCGGADGLSFVLPSGDVPPGDWSGACRKIFEVPVLRDSIPRGAQDPKWRSDGYGKALRAGFQLGWDRSSGECSRCEQANGKCGFSRAGELLGCLCADGRMDGDGCSKELANSSSLDSTLADGDYELVPVQGEGQLDGEVNAVDANQAPGQVPEEQLANPEPEGNSLEEMAASLTWPCQLPPGWTIEWDMNNAE